AAQKRSIFVTNTPAANAKSVAELTLNLILNLIRPVITASMDTRAGGWMRTDGTLLHGKTVGLIGLGAIGREVARRLQGFDCRILAFDITYDEAFVEQYSIQKASVDDLLPQSDFVSLHVPVLDATRGMVNAAFLAQMKPGSYLVNTARGELVDEDALVKALKSGHLKGAAIDAFHHEPPGKDHPLPGLPQVIPTPHMGAHTDAAANTMGRMAMMNCLAALKGQEPPNRVV
ncbi:MAG: NAD(P)-dependent oxidoreductase, partial [Chloroflexota bacterium]